MRTVLVLGATGVMGRRLVALTSRLLPDVRVLRGARRVVPEADPDGRLFAEEPPSGPLRLEQLVAPREAAEWLRAEGYQVTGVDDSIARRHRLGEDNDPAAVPLSPHGRDPTFL